MNLVKIRLLLSGANTEKNTHFCVKIINILRFGALRSNRLAGILRIEVAPPSAHGQHIGRCESRISAALRHAERQAVFLPKP